MSKAEERTLPNPTLEELKRELDRVRGKKRRKKKTLVTCIACAVVFCAVLVISVALPVMKIHGTSMMPTLSQGDVIVALRGDELSCGDLIAFEYGSKILVKRVIACAGDLVEVYEDGRVSVNQQEIDEPYVSSYAYGDPDIEQPYRVAMDEYFVLGDHREESVDSRYSALGCVSKDQVIGRVCMRIWPIDRIDIW